jgi:hypothetical protein
MVNRGVHYESHGVICMPQCFQMMFHVVLVLFNALDSRFLVSMPAAVQTVVHVVLVTTEAEKVVRENYSALPHGGIRLLEYIKMYKGTTCPTKNGFFRARRMCCVMDAFNLSEAALSALIICSADLWLNHANV